MAVNPRRADPECLSPVEKIFKRNGSRVSRVLDTPVGHFRGFTVVVPGATLEMGPWFRDVEFYQEKP